MAQISRPFQIALAAIGLLALVWIVALRGHSSPESSGSASLAPSARTAQSSGGPAATNPAAPTPAYKGAAPGVGGLSRAVAKAHEAVATSQQNAKQLETKAAQASSSTAAPTTSSASAAAPAAKAGAPPAPSRPAGALAQPPSHPATASRQLSVETALKHGSIVVLLIWNPKGTADTIVHAGLQRLLALHRRAAHAKSTSKSATGLHVEFNQPISVQQATPGQVAAFGSFTRDIQIFSTPTVLVVNAQGQVRTLTGVPGTLSIEQATDEARHP